jgi:putative endonuclease
MERRAPPLCAARAARRKLYLHPHLLHALRSAYAEHMPSSSVPHRLAPHMFTGMRGETIAAAYLHDIGYEIRGRNVRHGKGEIDILAHDPADDVLVFVEVKTRTRADEDFTPYLGFDQRKRRALCMTARRWVADNRYEGGYRIDLVCVAQGKVIDHVREVAWR